MVQRSLAADNFIRAPMNIAVRWEDGLFVFPMEVGDDGHGLRMSMASLNMTWHQVSSVPMAKKAAGWDSFQLLRNGSVALRQAGWRDAALRFGADLAST